MFKRQNVKLQKHIPFQGISSIEQIVDIIRECGVSRDLERGKQIHEYVSACGGAGDKYLANLFVQMYGRCGSLDSAFAVFNRIQRPNMYSWNILFQVYVDHGMLEAARNTFDNMPEKNHVSWNAMLAAYAHKGHLESATDLFTRMTSRNVVTWNSMITACINKGAVHYARDYFTRMPEHSAVSGTSMLTVYAEKGDFSEAKVIFERLHERDVMVWTAMIKACGDEGRLEDAKLVFSRMPSWNIVSWTSLMVALAERDRFTEAKELFESMPEHHKASCSYMMKLFAANGYVEETKSMFDRMPDRDHKVWNVLLTGFSRAGLLEDARATFQRMPCWSSVSFTSCMQYGLTHELKCIPEPDIVSATSMLQSYAQAGKVDEAKVVFDGMSEHDTFSWNIMLSAYVEAGQTESARKWFESIPRRNEFSWSIMLGVYGAGELGETLFSSMPCWDLHSCSSLMTGYITVGAKDKAESLFEEMVSRYGGVDEVWKSMFLAYADNGYVEEAERLFESMPRRSLKVWTALLAAYTYKGESEKAESLFRRMPSRDTVACNARLGGCKRLTEAREDVFDGMVQRDVASWNTLLSISGKEGKGGEEAREVYNRAPHWDMVSFSCFLQTFGDNNVNIDWFEQLPEWNTALCTSVIGKLMQEGNVEEAKRIFDSVPEIQRHGMIPGILVGYAQNGYINRARVLFQESAAEHSLFSWNVMLATEAQEGNAEEALSCYEMMNLFGVKPDESTFTTLFSSCSRGGLSEQAWRLFCGMAPDHGLKLERIHYRVMVDILGRLGKLEEAKELVDGMPFCPDLVAWRTLLGACRVHQDARTGEKAAESMVEEDKENPSPYIILSNIYSISV